MKNILDLIEFALKNNKKALSEYESKQVISACGIPVAVDSLVTFRKKNSFEYAGLMVR